MAFVVNLNGLKEVQGLLKNLDNTLKVEVSNEINASSLKILTDAKKNAPVNFGQLRNSIALTKDSDLTYSVEARASYAPFMEFGTGPQANVPATFPEFQGKYKGGGKFADMVLALTLWVQRKGIGNGKNDKSIAYLIARSILKKGLAPRPFLGPAYDLEKPKLIKRLKELLNA